MSEALRQDINNFYTSYEKITKELSKIIVGQKDIVKNVLIAIFGGGHVLLEGVPGLGKTLLIKTLSQVMDLEFSRIQFTPDLMPSDIIGTNIIQESETGHKQFEFKKGPLFANIILADEINRATPKTQSAMLEAMQERSISVFETTYKLQKPFFVLATQNPLELEGTYPLPEAQLDRFFVKLLVKYPSAEELNIIMDKTTGKIDEQVNKIISGEDILKFQKLIKMVPISSIIQNYAIKLALATHPVNELCPAEIRKYLKYGVSPRGIQSIILAAKVNALLEQRFNVSFEDITAVIKPCFRHRMILSFEAIAEEILSDSLISTIIQKVPKE